MDRIELEIYGRIAEAIAAAVREGQTHEPGSVNRGGKSVPLPIPYFYHCHDSVFESYAEILSRLGILQPVTPDPVECCFSFAIEQGRDYEQAISRAANGPPFSEVLTTFLSNAVDYGGGFRLYQQHPFPVCAELDPLFKLLAKAGYVQRLGREYRWTEKIVPLMEAADLWPLDDEHDEHMRRFGRR